MLDNRTNVSRIRMYNYAQFLLQKGQISTTDMNMGKLF